MARHLSRMSIDKVSLVDAGANDRRFAVLKRQAAVVGDAGTETFVPPSPGLVVPAPVAKSDDLTVLRDAAWAAVVARDSKGQPLTLVQKRAAFAKAFAAYDGSVEKAGRAISSARMTQLTQLGAALQDAAAGIEALIAGATPKVKPEEDEETDETDDQPVAKEHDMDDKELLAAIQPMIDEAVTKAVAAASVAKDADDDSNIEDQVTNAQLAEAITTLAGRIEGLEKSRSQAIPGAAETVKKSALTGIL